MLKKRRLKKIDSQTLDVLLTIVTAILSTAILAFSVLTMLTVYNHGYEEAPKYLVWLFVFMGLISFVLFLRERTKISFARFAVLFIFDIALGIVVLFANSNPFLFSLTAGLYCLTIVVSRVFKLVQRHNIRHILINVLIMVFACLFAIGLFNPGDTEAQTESIILIECVFIAIVSFIDAAGIAFSKLKIKVLLKIIVNTYSLEIIFGMLTMMVCFSLILMNVEPTMASFPDALWYCFAVVTTIGFGDFAAETTFGRIITVFLGLYGIIVVAVITSIIVNFYNETSGKMDKKEIEAIKKEEEGEED